MSPVTDESLTTQEGSYIITPIEQPTSTGESNAKGRTQSICLDQVHGISPKEGKWKLESDPKVSLLERDKELYDYQSKSIMHQIMLLTVKLNESKQRSKECNTIYYS